MNSLIHADIFFFISSVALIVIALGVIIALIYIIIIARNISHLTTKVKAESEEILKDVQELRGSIKESIKTEGLKLRTMAKFFGRFAGGRRRKNRDSE